MTIRYLICLFCVLLISSSFTGLQAYATDTNLKHSWLVYHNGEFRPYAEREVAPEVIYLRINTLQHKTEKLSIHALRPFDLFINNALAGTNKQFVLDLDSLSRTCSSHNLLVAVHPLSSGYSELSTVLQKESAHDPMTEGLVKREGSFFRDFAVVGIVLLFGMAVLIARLNPKLASDYFSVPGIFSTREIQDSQVYTRIGSSTNILFYAYCSMLLAYYLILIFHFTRDVFPLANSFEGDNFVAVAGQWMKLSLMILFLVFIKIILVFGISYLFGLGEIAGIHFFNWVRLLLVIFGLLTLGLFVYFIWHGQSVDVHATMLRLLGWIIGGWIILIFLKLSGSAGATMFHLFSYICATELIPFLFIIKVLYK
jgi:hypothetical protein